MCGRCSKHIISIGDYNLLVPEYWDGGVLVSFFRPASEKFSDLPEIIQIVLGDAGFEPGPETLQKPPSYHTLLSLLLSHFLGEGNNRLARGSSAGYDLSVTAINDQTSCPVAFGA